MSSRFTFVIAAAAVAAFALSAPQLASSAQAGSATSPFYKPTKPKPQVRGARQRVGGYSYTWQDSILDHRDRSVFLDPKLENNSTGPFDSGFFFDSGVERHNNSPYLY